MQHEPAGGICPGCDGAGPIGRICSNALCTRRGYHHVPLAHFDAETRRPDPLIGRMWDGYLLTRTLGEGAVGQVYLAFRHPVGLRAAVKVLRRNVEHDSEMGRRFDAEASALARLGHPNIVRLLGAGTVGDRPYIAMEYIEGVRTLADAMVEGVDLEAARRILLQTIDALHAAHQARIVHRDIKPTNIMLQSTVREPYFVRLVDFGLVKFTDDGDTTEIAAGTPIYMAPEQIRRSEIGPWTDWYAVGILAMELISGRRPFDDVPPKLLINRKMADDLDPLDAVADLNMPAAVVTFIDRMTATDIDRRPKAVEEVVGLLRAAFDALRALSAHPRPLATPLSASGALSGPPSDSITHAIGEMQVPSVALPRRSKAPAILVATLIGGLVVGIGWLAFFSAPTPTERDASPAERISISAGAPTAHGPLEAPMETVVQDMALPDASPPDADLRRAKPKRKTRRPPRRTTRSGAGARPRAREPAPKSFDIEEL